VVQETETAMIHFFAYGEPKGQPRPRAFHRNGMTRMYDPSTAEGWKGQIAIAARPFLPESPLDGPLYISAVFLLPRPKRLLRAKDPEGMIPHTSKPDTDNLAKALFDCLTEIQMWRDDAQIVLSRILKFYCEKNGRPGVSVVIDQWRSVNDET